MKIIVFSWNSNTWKSSAIKLFYDKLKSINDGYNIKIYGEIAREYLDMNIGKDIDRYEFQKYIADKDIERINRLKQHKIDDDFDFILVDRTIFDSIIYIYWNFLIWKSWKIDFIDDIYTYIEDSKNIYDKVVFFSLPIKNDKRFDDYNNDNINWIFENSIEATYRWKICKIDNNIILEKDIDKYLNLIIN